MSKGGIRRAIADGIKFTRRGRSRLLTDHLAAAHRQTETAYDEPPEARRGPRVSSGANMRARRPEVQHQFPASVLKIQERIKERRRDGRWDGITLIHLMQRPAKVPGKYRMGGF